MPEYTKAELTEWLFSQELFHKLFQEWKISNFKKELIPSVDRIDNSKGYSFGNIQLMTWNENNYKAHADRKSGQLITTHKTVLQFTKDGKFVAKYISIHQAGRETGISFKSISRVCNGERNFTGGYVWKFKN